MTLCFLANGRNRPLSNMSMLMMLRRMGREDLTVTVLDRHSVTGQPTDKLSARGG